MAIAPAHRAYLVELFAPVGAVSIRRMFGFDGIFCHDLIIGLATDERIYLKTDAQSREAYLREGMGPLVYQSRNGNTITMTFYMLPERLYDEPDEFVLWAQQAYEVALRSPSGLRKHRKQIEKKRIGGRS